MEARPMPTHLQGVLCWINTVVRDSAVHSDAQLLEQFVHHHDTTAFALLMKKHGPMVHAVCRRLLGDGHDSEDAFQATFLVLLLKARSIAWREQLGPWLYGVALRTAQKARFRRDRRWAVERRADVLPDRAAKSAPATDGLEWLDQEVCALQERYRLPLVLCELQGLSRRDAARQLGLAEGTLSSRLARGRKLLHRRLARRGVALTGSVWSATLCSPAGAGVPRVLVERTLRTAALLAADTGAVAQAVSPCVLVLMEGVLHTMAISKIKIGVAALLAVLTLASLTVLGAMSPAAVAPAAISSAAAAKPAQPQEKKAKPVSNDKRVVAIIYGDIAITREELGEFLIARYGAEKVQLLVNQRIIEHACAKKGITLTPQEVKAALNEDLATLNVKRTEFIEVVLKRYGKTLFEWQEDVIKPRLLLSKLCRADIKVGEEDLRQMFENLYGKKVCCKAVTWAKGEKAAARAMYDKIKDNDVLFDQAARAQANKQLAANDGILPPPGRHDGGQDSAIVAAAFKLKVGEVSPLLTTEDGTLMVVKCLSHVPPVADKDFAMEKPALLREVLARKIAQEIPKLFKEQREEANPQIFLPASPTAVEGKHGG
jgi:RNA polymerase sigma factor (sigma-70 family)